MAKPREASTPTKTRMAIVIMITVRTFLTGAYASSTSSFARRPANYLMIIRENLADQIPGCKDHRMQSDTDPIARI